MSNAMSKKPTPESPTISVREAGKKGGETVKRRYGERYYKTIGRKGGLTIKDVYGRAFYEASGSKGGKTTRERHGREFYQEIGHKGGQRVKQLIEEGKRAAQEAAQAAEHTA